MANDARVETVGRRIVEVLQQLPHFRSSHDGCEAVNIRTGERVVPSRDEQGFDHGVLVVIQDDGETQKLPGHHYLDEQLFVAAGDELGTDDERKLSGRASAMLDTFRRTHEI